MVKSPEHELIRQNLEMVERLKQADSLFINAHDGNDPDGRDVPGQRRVACIEALNAVLEYLAVVEADPAVRRPLHQLQGALLDADQGISTSLFQYQKRSAGQRRTYLRAIVTGEAVAAVEYLLDAGLGNKAAYQHVAKELDKFDMGSQGFKGWSADSVKNWFDTIPTTPSSATNPARALDPNTMAKDRYIHVRRLAESQLMDASPHKKADWIIREQIAFRIPKKHRRD